MIINRSNLVDLQRAYAAAFNGGFGGVEPTWKRIATEVPSSTAVNDYGWLGSMPRMREWIGARVVKNITESQYSVRNRPFEMTVAVPRDAIADDQYGVYTPMMTAMGLAAAQHPDELVYQALVAGLTTNCYDGQFFFDVDHPVGDAALGNVATVSNYQAGAGAPWFLMDTRKFILPLLFQSRKKAEFVSKTDSKDDNVFDRAEYVYGVDARYNVGYTFWQLAYCSKAALTQANFRAARNAMMAFKGDNGERLGINPNLLVVGVTNNDAARDIILAERNSAGATNTDRNLVEILVAPLLD